MEKEITIEEGNKLIENFWVKQGGRPHSKEDIWFYESDWNMIMPVVEKIDSLSYNERRGHKFNPQIERFLENDIKAIRNQIIFFILWYNSTKQ